MSEATVSGSERPVLDNPIWFSLVGAQRSWAEGTGFARRYPADVSMLAALAPGAGPEAWSDLAETCAPGDALAVFFAGEPHPVGGGLKVVFEGAFDQMVCAELLPAEVQPHRLEVLGAADADEMLALVKLTQPGPFAKRTVELGNYLGVREGGVLIAMAGERLHPDAHREVSAVCTHPDHRGRGLADALVRELVRTARARGETSFLHVALGNDTARRAYERIGFERRLVMRAVAVQRPREG